VVISIMSGFSASANLEVKKPLTRLNDQVVIDTGVSTQVRVAIASEAVPTIALFSVQGWGD
jgi:hypothetical protein